LNLVWALREKDCFASKAEVAINGAGLTGLTASAGFAGYGCEVNVCEEAGITMARQSTY
jgi:2-polyprenyl-6-methoxyphenol hydroxylase-like FAD-dependent oxidoreductase